MFPSLTARLLPSNAIVQIVTVQISSELQRRFASAQRVFVLTGAGISAESGVPTFRGGGNSAVWKGMPFDVISSATMVERDLNAVWEWFDYRRGVLSALKPNPAHYALAEWQDKFSEFTLVTQNVDGLHAKAGSRDVIEVHGSIWRARCLRCLSRFGLLADEAPVDSCPSCGELLRPDVVLFGEMLPMDAYDRAAKAASECELCFVIGTSALVYPAASLPEMAKDHGAFVVEINPERTPLSALCDEVLTGKAGEIVPLLNKTSV